MTSSKSFRAAVLSSSLSFSTVPSSNTDSDSDALSSRSSSSISDPKDHAPPRRTCLGDDQVKSSCPVPRERVWILGDRHYQLRPASPVPRLRKSKTFSDRLTSFFPSLTSSSSTDLRKQSIQRKPVGSVRKQPSISSSEPADESQPIGPYHIAQLMTQQRNGSGGTLPSRSDTMATSSSNYSQSTELSIQTPDSFASAHSGPKINDPIPPTPDTTRPFLSKQQAPSTSPVASTSPRRASPPSDADLPGQTSPRDTGRLHKDNPDARSRRSSLQQPKTGSPQFGIQFRQTSPFDDSRGRRSFSAQIPPKRTSVSGNRVASQTFGPRAPSPGGSQSPTRGRIRRSWLPGGRSRSNSKVNGGDTITSYAWVLSGEGVAEYNPGILKHGERVPELWDERGSVCVYLHPKGQGLGPSFKVARRHISASVMFNELIQGGSDSGAHARNRARSFDGRGSLSVDDATRLLTPNGSPPTHGSPDDVHLYLPPPRPDANIETPKCADPELERLIGLRNLFAFLTGQPLIGTKTQPTAFCVFRVIADLLLEFGFKGTDEHTFGEHVNLSFGFYIEQFQLADCRSSREKTVEALILGERMRSEELYREAYAHAVGKYDAIIDLELNLLSDISPLTRQGLEKSRLDLNTRQINANRYLEQLDSPALFAGIASSNSQPELKQVRFKIWRNSFNKMRQLALGFYKTEFGSWPPKARSKKNPFAENGLNRIVLKILYKDMCDLYDLLVDRTKLTTRIMDQVPEVSGTRDPITAALHTLLSEFDRSKPPVLPPIPFDMPQPPAMTTILETYPSLSPRDQNKFDKKLKDHELELVLNKAYNYDAISRGIDSTFLEEFRRLELREAKGKTAQDMFDQRIGYWIFLYTIIQSLPMLVVDAPGLKHTGDVEYFLCQPHMGRLPWQDDATVKKLWYGVAGGDDVVELATDTIMFSVEGTYHRSHCWLAAKKWDSADGAEAEPAPAEAPAVSPLQPPPPILPGGGTLLGSPSPLGSPQMPGSPSLGPTMQPPIRPRHLSPASRNASRSSIALGLEPVPLEPPSVFGSQNRSSSLGPRPPSSHLSHRSISVGDLGAMNKNQDKQKQAKRGPTPSATFDQILGKGEDNNKSASKRKSRFF